MKKDRNCTMNMYPMMPGYGMMPGQMMGMPGMVDGTINSLNPSDTNSLTNQINTLEKRVSRLENIVNGSNYSANYNSSNYQMM